MRTRLEFCRCGEIKEGNGCSCKQSKQSHDRTKKERGYGWDWEQLSKSFRRDNPLCWRCLSDGKTTPTDHAHHVIPIETDPTKRLDRSNLAALCKECHAEVENETRQGKPFTDWPGGVPGGGDFLSN